MGRTFATLFLALALVAPCLGEEPGFLTPSVRTGNSELFLIQAAKGDARNVTNSDKAEELFPAWSRDGKRIAFTCKTREHDFEVFTADADGSHRQRLTTTAAPGICLAPAWSADGKSLAYMRFMPKGTDEIRVVNADGSGDRLLVSDAIAPAWSPDGTAIAYLRKNPGKPASLCLVHPDGKQPRVLVENLGGDGLFFPAWSPDGRWIAFSVGLEYGMQIALIRPFGGPVQQITHLPGFNSNPVWIATDRLMFAHVAQAGSATGAYVSIKVDGTRLTIHPLTKAEAARPICRPAVYLPPVPAYKEKNALSEFGSNEFNAWTIGHRIDVPVKGGVTTASAHVVKPAPHAVPVVIMPPAAPGSVNTAAWSTDGKRLALSLQAGVGLIGEFDGKSFRLVDLFRGHEGTVDAVAFSKDGQFLHTAGADKTVRTWDIAKKGSTSIETDQSAPVDSLAVSHDGKRLASGGHDGKVKIRNAATAKAERTIDVCGDKLGSVYTLAFGQDDNVLFAGCARWDVPVLGGAVAAFDPATGKELWRTKGTMGGVISIALSPDGTKLAGACLDTFVRIWDAKTGKELACWKGHGDRVTGAAWGLGGKVLVTCGFDHTVRLWDAAHGTVLQTLATHPSPVARVAVSPDGKWVASAGLSGLLCIWRLEE